MRTPSGRFEFKIEEYGLEPLPHHVEPIDGERRTPEIHAEHPLILKSGRLVGVMFHSEHRRIPWLREVDPDPPVEIHPETAAKYGTKDGDWALIELRRRLHQDDALPDLEAAGGRGGRTCLDEAC